MINIPLGNIIPLKVFGLLSHFNPLYICCYSLIIIEISLFRYWLSAPNKSLLWSSILLLSLLDINMFLYCCLKIEQATILVCFCSFSIFSSKTLHPHHAYEFLFSYVLCSLWQLELFLSSGTVCLSVYSLVAAIFGMNIPTIWKENHEYAFKWVCVVHNLFMK